MLSSLLSSKPKTNLINLFLAHPQRSFSYTELRVNSHCPNKLLKSTIKELEKMEFLQITAKNRVRFFQMNRHFPLYPELVNLLRNVKNLPTDELADNLAHVGDCKLAALTGVFVGKPRMETDLLIVGKVSSRKLGKLLELAEKFAQQQVNYTVFDLQEFEYRKSMNDRFVKNILDNNPLLVVDKTKHRVPHKIGYRK